MNYYNEIKNELINHEIYKRVKHYSMNKSDLNTYYTVGKMLKEAGKSYGEGIIKEYSKKLTKELGKGYTPSRLRYYRRFFDVFSKCPTLSDELTYSHYCEIIWLSENEINYYMKISIERNLSVRELRVAIKNKEYQRLDDNTKNKLVSKNETKVEDFIKNPILIKNRHNDTEISEKILHQFILEDISSFMKELGTGFSFIDSEYKIKIGDRYNYLDFLFYNIEFNCYVVVELKSTKLKKEHIGQIQIYMNYIDIHLKKASQDQTIGIILCKEENQYVIEYCSNDSIIARKYMLI